jgi:hypothetical protein
MMRMLAAALLLGALGCGNPACDSKLFAVTCTYPPDAGECVDFMNLSTNDQTGTQNHCLSRGGVYDAGPCTAAGRLGTCRIPPTTPNADVSCSPIGIIDIRYYGSFIGSPQQACADVPDASFTPN